MPKNPHHANLLLGAPEEAESYLRSLCKDLDFKLANNPDFFPFRTDTFGIDEARMLRMLSARKAIAGRKIFFISAERLTLEAQSALLKPFDNPFPDTFFFLAAREEASIEPTLSSRMQTIRLPRSSPSSGFADAERFLSRSIKDRLLFAKKFTDEEANLSIFLDNLLTLLRINKETFGSVEKVYKVRHFAFDPAVASRLIIEHLALVL